MTTVSLRGPSRLREASMERIIYCVVGTVLGAAVGTFGCLFVMDLSTIPQFGLATGACGAVGAVIGGIGGALLDAKFLALTLSTVFGAILGCAAGLCGRFA